MEDVEDEEKNPTLEQAGLYPGGSLVLLDQYEEKDDKDNKDRSS